MLHPYRREWSGLIEKIITLRQAKEAAEFEQRHALEEAARRAADRQDAERWAREQVRPRTLT